MTKHPGESTATALDDFEATLRPLWDRGQEGDEAAYRQALEQIAKRLRGWFRRRMQTLPDDVEDLVQETLLAIHLQRGTYDPKVPVSRWVFAIARHKLIDLWRRRGRREARHLVLDDLAEGALPTVNEEFPVQRDLATLLGTLPQTQRAAITMTKLEGLTMDEASQRSGTSVSALKVQVHRGLKRLSELARKTL
ncbi:MULTISPECIES: sigma-70 family RNA polymerase sigma factor [Thiorhodovibrio]|uniref:sigma-70 family RNA polymerase sigma factor n=1 Tax=Thiorhodovibrio TaxID=61593 RepID=UPI0019142026|nr:MULTISPECIES: sigma-70 family RNA polymerase sigma factor [Thiorhodovibrio]MBK5969489.1 RNA polymerase subunit sigma [Thiorhodovibrio winogradskyi]WPL12380.1 putative RNA polymerase sigma factor FecI [Thiorhodovibrio litoralis]